MTANSFNDLEADQNGPAVEGVSNKKRNSCFIADVSGISICKYFRLLHCEIYFVVIIF